jgi:Ras family.
MYKKNFFSLLQASFNDVPVVLVGNKTDQVGDRMVSTEDGTRRCREIGCLCFHEISIRESIDQVRENLLGK